MQLQKTMINRNAYKSGSLSKGTVSKIGLTLMTHLFFTVMSLMMLFPLFWMISSSLKDKSEIFLNPPLWIPKHFHWNNFTVLFTERGYALILGNSLFVSCLYTVGALFLCAMAGFAFSKYKFRGQGLLFGIVLASMMIPIEASMIPLFIVYKKLGLIDNLWGIILPGMANAFGIFYMRQFFASFHTEIMESARIDGCSEFGIFGRIALPNVKPAFASLGIIFFVNQWNNFLWPSVILRSEENMTISVAIRALDSGFRTPYELVMSGSVLSVIPLLVIILLFQKQYIAGLMDGAVKG